MEVDPEETPSSFDSISCERDQEGGIKLMKNTTDEGNVFYHVAKEPPEEQIESPEDIKTLRAFRVESEESQSEVASNAMRAAMEEARKA